MCIRAPRQKVLLYEKLLLVALAVSEGNMRFQACLDFLRMQSRWWWATIWPRAKRTKEFGLIVRIRAKNAAKTPPFTIETDSDGGEELRMEYRYLDIRRAPVRENLMFRHKVTMAIRNYLSKAGFIDVETPYLIKSTPEGARDFVVPSRMNEGQFYALPQSPQTFKQLLMVGGLDKYFQIVKCFRDEDLRADRQPEFTQIDCEMSFVTQEDVLQEFEGLVQHLLKEIKGIAPQAFPRMTYTTAMERYGNDKPDIRFGMEFGTHFEFHLESLFWDPFGF